MKDLVGLIVNNITVLKFDKIKSISSFGNYGIYYRQIRYWLCKCSCGKEISVRESQLLYGKLIQSCGCMNIRSFKHGCSRLPEYIAWQSLKDRCKKPNNVDYKYYKDRGINICNFIDESFKNFYSIIGKRPSKYYSVERIDNDKGYTCGKCEDCIKNNYELNIKWDTFDNQAKNKQPRRISILGIEKSCYDFAKIYKEIIEKPLFII